MALTPPPPRTKKEAVSEADIEAMINRGGAVAVAVSKEATPEIDPNTVRHVNARLTEAIIRQIDTLRASRARKIGSPKMGVSLRDWVVEAVMEKLERDTKKMSRNNKTDLP